MSDLTLVCSLLGVRWGTPSVPPDLALREPAAARRHPAQLAPLLPKPWPSLSRMFSFLGPTPAGLGRVRYQTFYLRVTPSTPIKEWWLQTAPTYHLTVCSRKSDTTSIDTNQGVSSTVFLSGGSGGKPVSLSFPVSVSFLFPLLRGPVIAIQTSKAHPSEPSGTITWPSLPRAGRGPLRLKTCVWIGHESPFHRSRRELDPGHLCRNSAFHRTPRS